MKVGDRWYRTIWPSEDGGAVEVIDQTRLPHAFEVVRLQSLEAAAEAIRVMQVRGAPLVGATAAYGLCLALQEDSSDQALQHGVELLAATATASAARLDRPDRQHSIIVIMLADDKCCATVVAELLSTRFSHFLKVSAPN